MKITNLDFWRVELKPLEEKNSPEVVSNILVRIETSRGIQGYGCAAPETGVTGETPESVEAALGRVAKYSLQGDDPLRLRLLMERLKSHLPANPAALTAVEMALYDILGKQARLPLWRLLGGYRERIKTGITLPAADFSDLLESGRSWVARGFTCLKVMGIGEPEADVERVLALRRELGPKIDLRFDARGKYTVQQTRQFVQKTQAARLEFLEQPTPGNQPDLLKTVTGMVQIPVVADECLKTRVDYFEAARRALADLVSLKLMRVGGIGEAQQVNAIARAARQELVIGCGKETALATAAALHFALSQPNVAFAELDAPLKFSADPTAGALSVKNGYLYPSAKPGFGFNISTN